MKFIPLLILSLLPLGVFSQSQITRCPEDLVPKYDKKKKLWGFSNLFGQWVIEPTYTKVTPFIEDKAVVQKGLSYGVIACDGQVIISPMYQSMTSYRAGKIWVQKNRFWGVMDDKGKVLLDFQYSEINPIAHSPLSWIKKTDLWGLFDEEKGRILCAPQFPMATIMSPNASLVKVGEKFGVLNHVNCGYLIKPEITKVKKVAKNIIVFKQNGLWGLFNEYGILRMNPEFDTIYSKYPETLIGVKKGKQGLYDLSGKEVLPPIYDAFGELSEGLFSIRINGNYGFATRQGKVIIAPQYQWADRFLQKLAIIKKENAYGVIDYTNKLKLPLSSINIFRFDEGQFAIKQKDSKYYIYGSKINQLSNTGYDSVYADNHPLIRVKINGKMSFFDLDKSTTFSSKFDESEAYLQNFAKVRNGSYWGIVDSKGNIVVDLKYDSIIDGNWEAKKIWVSWLDGKCGAIDTTGKVLLATEYDKIYYSGSGIIKLKKNNLWGIVKSNGSFIVNFEYSDLSLGSSVASAPEFPAIATAKQKQGLLNEHGILVYPLTSDSIYHLGSKLYRVKGKTIKLIDEKGILISKATYDGVTNVVGQYIGIQKNNKWGVIDTKGTEIIKPQYAQILLCPRFFAVQSKDKWGTVTTNGTAKTPFQYEKAVQIGDEIFLYIGDKKYSLDTFGNIE